MTTRALVASIPSSPLPLLAATVALAAAAVLATHRGAAAQSVVVDEGVYLVSRGGQAVGTEQFAIRRTSSGAGSRLIATAEVELELPSGGRRISSALEVSRADGAVNAYQLKVSGDRSAEIYMTLSGRRFQAKVVTREGEQVREFRASDGTVVLDEGLAHLYHFLGARLVDEESRVPVVVPMAGDQMIATVSTVETERIQIAGGEVQARHLRARVDGSEREVWIDEEGRVLRVLVPETGYRAERRDLPG